MEFGERRSFQFSRKREMNCERRWEGEKEKSVDNFWEEGNKNVKITWENIGAMLEGCNHILKPSLLLNLI